MARADLLNILYSKNKTPLEFNFDSLWIPGMHNYIYQESISKLYNIASSVMYASKIELKYKEMDAIMSNFGFKKFASGTNRRIYNYLEDQTFLAKVAVDKVGLGDGPAEFRNQAILKPFVTKTFEVSQCGSISLSERVQPITLWDEYTSIGGDIYDLIYTCIVGKYVLEDIGSKYFMNWGVRNGFGPVLLDYPYVFELDGNKLNCTRRIDGPNSPMCGGEIDYDIGFNTLVCERCGQKYLAKDLQKAIETKSVTIIKGDLNMTRVVLLGANGDVICDPGLSSNTILPPKPKKQSRASDGGPKIVLNIPGVYNEPELPKVIEKTSVLNTGVMEPPIIKEEEPAPVVKSLSENEEQNDDRKQQFSQDMTQKFVLYNIFEEGMKKYPFEEDKHPNLTQRKKMEAFLQNHLTLFMATTNDGMSLTDEEMKEAVKVYLDTNYKFENYEDGDDYYKQQNVEQSDNSKDEYLEKYREFDIDENESRYEKIRSNKKVLDNY